MLFIMGSNNFFFRFPKPFNWVKLTTDGVVISQSAARIYLQFFQADSQENPFFDQLPKRSSKDIFWKSDFIFFEPVDILLFSPH